MQLTPETLNHIFTNLDMRFNTAYTNTEPMWQRIATEVPSTGRNNTYPLRSFLPKMREWIGERQVQNGMAYEYTIVNKDWEGTISVKRNDIEDDNLGIYGNEADFLGEAAKVWPDEVVFDLLMKGEETAGHDGQNFFDTDHPVTIGDAESATQSNVYNVPDLTPEVLAALEGIAGSWANERGDSLGISFNLLVVPGVLAYRAAIANGPMIIEQGQAIPNPMANRFEVLSVPRLNRRPKEFYLMMTNRALKPLIWQVRKAPTFTTLDAPTDTNVFWRKEYIYGVDARGNAGFGLWFMAIKAKITAGAPIPTVPEQP